MPWWYDTIAVAQTLKLRDQFTVTTFVETGCYRGINLRFHSFNFPNVIGVEKSAAYITTTRQRCADLPNVRISHDDSPAFLRSFALAYSAARRTDIPFFYLDAHFYDPAERWVIKRELHALRAYCYITDAMVMFWRIFFSDYNGEAFNIGNQTAEVSIRGLAEQIHELCAIREPPQVQRQESTILQSAPHRVCPDTSKILSLFHYQASIPLREGLVRTLQWNQEENTYEHTATHS